MRIILIGFMGVGKTYLGSRVAEKTGVSFYDTDSMLENQTGKTISEIFRNMGEEWFRKKESELLLNLPINGISATGGGIVELEQNREFLKKRENSVLWLHSGWEDVYKRINRTDRPLYQKLSKDELYRLWQNRLPLYRECADFILMKDDISDLYDLIKKILKHNSKLTLT